MVVIVWRYEVRDEYRREFQAFHAASGEWAKLFGRSGGYEGAVLRKGEDRVYLPLDHWRSREAFDTFLSSHGADYRTLDARSEGWTHSETRIGIFDAAD